MKLKSLLPLLGVLAGLSAGPAVAAPFEVGKPFPDLVLPDLETGKPTSLARFRGRPLALHVFASW